MEKSSSNTSVDVVVLEMDVVVVLVELNIEDIVVLSACGFSDDRSRVTTTGIVIINIDDTIPSNTNANVYLFLSLLICFL